MKSWGIARGAPSSTATSESYGRALESPLWWLCLGVLVVNDHLLKGAGVLDPWLTGKFSDFAGLVVAPVLACVVVRGRVLGFALVVVPFVAMKLSANAADAVVASLSWFGIHWRLWSDPTDLVALVVLPFAWRMLDARPKKRAVTRVHRLAVLVGGIACLATSTTHEEIETAAYLVNTTHDDLEIHIYRVDQPLDCEATAADAQTLLTADRFSFESCKRVEPFIIVPLDTDWRGLDTETTKQNPRENPPHLVCDAVIVRIPGAEDTVVFWNAIAQVQVDMHGGHRVTVSDDDPHAIYVEELGSQRLLGASDLFQTWTIAGELPPPVGACEDAP